MRYLRKQLSKNKIARITYHISRWLLIPKYRKDWDLIYVVDDSYHSFFSIKLVTILSPILYLVYKIIINRNLIFSVNNISHAIGHAYPEIDALIRMRKVGQIDNKYKILYIYPKSPVLLAIKLIIEKCDVDDKICIIQSGLLNLMIAPLLLKYPELTVCASISAVNMKMDENKKLANSLHFGDVIKYRMTDYAILRKQTRFFIPFNVNWNLPAILREFVGLSKYIVIQIKDTAVNGTLHPVDPVTYIKAIQKAKELNYAVIFAGREKMPNSFINEGVINYSESSHASPLNDFLLVLNSVGVISSASGFAFMADIIEKPLLTLNSWHIVGYPGIKTISIPSRIELNGRLLTLVQQYEFSIQNGQNIHKMDNCVSIDASSQDIYDGFIDMIKFAKNKYYPETIIQKEFKNLFTSGPILEQDSIISTKFLMKSIN